MEQFLVFSSGLLWVVVALNLLLTLAIVRRLSQGMVSAKVQGPPVGQEAPMFTANTLHGETVTRDDFLDQDTVFIFVSPHCGPCRDHIPEYEALRLQAQQSGTNLVLVSTADTETTSSFVQELDIHLPVLVAPDTTNTFLSSYNITGTPTYCFVNADGIVQSNGTPFLQFPSWQSLVTSWQQPPKRKPQLVSNGRR